MDVHLMEFPREVLLGRDVLSRVGELINQFGFHDPLIIAGPKTHKIAASKIEDEIHAEVLIVKDSNVDKIEEIKCLLMKKGIDVVIGVGGGKIMDTAKLSASWANLPWISVPTSSSNDSLSSQAISFLLSREAEEKGKSKKAHAPLCIVIDMAIVEEAPHRMLVAGCGDLISNYTAVRDWELAHRLKGEYYSEYAAALSMMSAKLAVENARVIKEAPPEGARLVVKGLVSSGVAMSIAGSSRPASGSEHLFSHALDLLGCKAYHGEQSGVGTIMMMYLHNADWKSMRDVLKFIGAPTTSEDLGVNDETIVEALTLCHTLRDRYTILGEDGLTRKAAKALAEKTGVIQ
ncbi:MAG: NAD(P)-dependent glycerol-1-phosphate dehydrogenase [Theionarchaea archaeon]|nr:NAD(P)-dependent glycerol-1-phosphate dehydrogenase [Theionarchaea archaeon]